MFLRDALKIPFASFALLSYLLSVTPAPVSAQSPAIEKTQPPLSAQDWRDDLQFLAAQMRLKHKSLFHSMTEAQFNQAVEKLEADIPRLNEDQIFVRLQQIMEMVQDGHSGFDTRPFPSSEQKEQIPPIGPVLPTNNCFAINKLSVDWHLHTV